MRIGEFARRSGVPAKTLRYYEEIGVLASPARTPGGYRDYDEGSLPRLRFVRAAQAVGLTLGEIREIVGFRDRGETPCAHVTELIQQRAAELDDRIAELERMRAELRRLARRARSLDPADCEPAAVCHVIGAVRAGGNPRR
jgi:MerR family copper efflux transcriptional regulator